MQNGGELGRTLALEYDGRDAFEFRTSDCSDSVLRGFFVWDDSVKKRMLALDHDEDDVWYLDSEGNRLPDEGLFAKSPWSLVNCGARRKVVRRFMDYNTGEAWFALEPWIQLYDWIYNNPLKG